MINSCPDLFTFGFPTPINGEAVAVGSRRGRQSPAAGNPSAVLARLGGFHATCTQRGDLQGVSPSLPTPSPGASFVTGGYLFTRYVPSAEIFLPYIKLHCEVRR
ncbi:hypothetical protein [Brasilonema bromeliae]|uniref:hypothetical protein n=1 Tax=Brasilonema bromeliae TaxID=383615 RepID=UPI00145DE449|nr:hypothetical protein [Brasilonema bromeliae]